MFNKFLMLLTALVLGGCAVPTTHSPYYKPIYPDMNRPGSPWLASFGSMNIQNRLRFKFSKNCFMQLLATPSDSDFILSWTLEQYGERNDACNYVVGNETLSIEDTKTGQHIEPKSAHRIFSMSGPKLDLRMGLQSYSPYFSETPLEQQTYTVAIPLRLDVDKKIPDVVSIKLPDILIGGHPVTIPVLTLKKVETGGNIKAYIPTSTIPMTNTEAITSYGRKVGHFMTRGAMGAFFSGASLWFEEKGKLRVASSFSGRDDVKTSKWITPGINGKILIKVMSGKGITLSDSRATWMTKEGKEIVQNINTSKLELVAYRTRLSDDIHFQEQKHDFHFIISLSNFRPERVRLKLPSLGVDGTVRRIKPIDFKYASGGIGFAAWP